MPELPETEITKRSLGGLIGKKVESFEGDWPKSLRVYKSLQDVSRDIIGRNIIKLDRQGKVIFIHLSAKGHSETKIDRILAFHQRMSGSLILRFRFSGGGANVADMSEDVEKHIRVRVGLGDGVELLFVDPRKFGVVWYGDPTDVLAERYLASLGPDALDLSFERFVDRLKIRRGMIKPTLLRQDVLAGVGNYVVDETLWQARVNPQSKLEHLAKQDIKVVHQALQQVLGRSISARGLSLRDWKDGGGQEGHTERVLSVYSQGGKPCRRCATKISRIVVGGRGTWICAGCQIL